MQMPFWNASAKLKKNEISEIVETASGLHLIQRWNDDPEVR
jgi:parvulin-like peptidyl-prolyl isomerase